MKLAILIDLDGTVCDSEHMHLHPEEIARNEWNWFEQLIRHGKVFPFAKIIVQSLSQYYFPIFVTARESSRREPTECWIEDNLELEEYQVYMRPIGTSVPTAEYKAYVYETFIKDNYEIVVALDDNPTCIALWNSLNIPTLQVCAGEQLNVFNTKKTGE